jgi:hypothetical protein
MSGLFVPLSALQCSKHLPLDRRGARFPPNGRARRGAISRLRRRFSTVEVGEDIRHRVRQGADRRDRVDRASALALLPDGVDREFMGKRPCLTLVSSRMSSDLFVHEHRRKLDTDRFAARRRLAERRLEASVMTLLRASRDRRIVAGPWLGEVGWELLYWIPLLRWCVNRWPDLKDRLVVVSRGGVKDWYAGISDTYLDLGEIYDAKAFASRLTGDRRWQAERGLSMKQSVETPWGREIAGWAGAKAGEPHAVLLHPALLYSSKHLVWSLAQASESLAPWEKPALGRLRSILSGRYVAVRFYESAVFGGEEAENFARTAVETLAEQIPIVLLNSAVVDPEHPDYLTEIYGARLSPYIEFANNLAIQSAVIAHADAFVGNAGGLSYLAPHYGVSSICFWAPGRRGNPEIKLSTRIDLSHAKLMFSGSGWGRYVVRAYSEIPVEELLAPALLEAE